MKPVTHIFQQENSTAVQKKLNFSDHCFTIFRTTTNPSSPYYSLIVSHIIHFKQDLSRYRWHKQLHLHCRIVLKHTYGSQQCQTSVHLWVIAWLSCLLLLCSLTPDLAWIWTSLDPQFLLGMPFWEQETSETLTQVSFWRETRAKENLLHKSHNWCHCPVLGTWKKHPSYKNLELFWLVQIGRYGIGAKPHWDVHVTVRHSEDINK